MAKQKLEVSRVWVRDSVEVFQRDTRRANLVVAGEKQNCDMWRADGGVHVFWLKEEAHRFIPDANITEIELKG